MHHDPKEQKLHLHVLLEQKDARVYSQMLWLHLEMLLAVAAAVLYLLFPVEQKCAVVFGHPKHKGNNTVLHKKTKAHILTENICSDSITFQNCRRALILLKSYLVNTACWLSLCHIIKVSCALLMHHKIF